VLINLGEEGEEVEAELQNEISLLKDALEELEIELMLDDADDEKSAIVTLHPGAGGTESQDWASMLYRMYLRWCERKGYKTTIFDYQDGEEAGLKSVTFNVQGLYAYGFLKAEIGVHRLVRRSPFDAANRRHTSFASVFVYPEVDEKIEVVIDEKDLRVDTYRSSGAGGQHVNVTDSAVRLTHIPTGIVVQCQNERSQHRNREVAMKVLAARLYQHEKEKQLKKKEEAESAQKEIAWGSQIRSYVLHPYRLVKDHRTSLEIGDVDRVLDGDLDRFIHAFLLGTQVEKN